MRSEIILYIVGPVLVQVQLQLTAPYADETAYELPEKGLFVLKEAILLAVVIIIISRWVVTVIHSWHRIRCKIVIMKMVLTLVVYCTHRL